MTPQEAEVVVIGAGPAGLAAAAAMAERGQKRILVIDRDDAAGGLPRFCAHPGFGWEFTHRLETGPAFARRLLATLNSSVVTLLTRTTALALRAGPELDVLSAEHGHLTLAPRAVVLATGIRERPRSARLVPGRRPERGVLTTGQLQQMVARGVRTGGRRAVIVGTEHVAFSVLLTAHHAGLKVVGMIGAEDRVMSYGAVGWFSRIALGLPIHLSSTLSSIEGADRVEAVVIQGPTGERRIPCDTVVFTGDFIPDAAMLPASPVVLDPLTHGPMVDQFGRTTSAGVFAAGNLLRAVETSGHAAIEGRRVGGNVTDHLRAATGWSRASVTVNAGKDLAYVMPQLWSTDGSGEALTVSLRSRIDSNQARLRLAAGDQPLWVGEPRKVLRQRRIALPKRAIDRLLAGNTSQLTLELT